MRIEVFLRDFGISFVNLSLFEEALTHSSYKNENENCEFDSERFEFLGDSVLNLIAADFFMKKNKDSSAGDLTSLRKKFINNKILTEAAKRIGLDQYIRTGKGTLKDEAARERILAITFEALIGAIFLDSKSLKAAGDFVERVLFIPFAEEANRERDFKSALQIIMNKKTKKNLEIYKFFRLSKREFRVVCTVGDLRTEATGKSKKDITQTAAKEMIELIERRNLKDGKDKK